MDIQQAKIKRGLDLSKLEEILRDTYKNSKAVKGKIECRHKNC